MTWLEAFFHVIFYERLPIISDTDMLFRTKLSLFLSLACLSFIVCAGWLYYIINNDLFLREARQRNLQYARHLSHDLRGIFQNEIARAKTLAQDSLLRSALEDSNDVFMAMDGQSRDQDIKALNQQWMEAKSAESAFRPFPVITGRFS